MKDNNKHKIKLSDINKMIEPEKEISSSERLKMVKKPVIFVLMGLVFIGCMYMIFEPSSDKDEEKAGLNEVVPQATDTGMQEDKGKAYEAEFLKNKKAEERNSLRALSDYWSEDSAVATVQDQNEVSNQKRPEINSHQQALNSYKNIQSTLGSFYDNQGETDRLRKEIQVLKKELSQKEVPISSPVENQLALMEKSYEMAAKYFPANNVNKGKSIDEALPKDSLQVIKENKKTAALYPARINIVSALYREPSDSSWIAGLHKTENKNSFTSGTSKKSAEVSNSLSACIHEKQTVTDGNSVRIRLSGSARIAALEMPEGTVLTAVAKFQGTRLQLLISSIEYKGSIVPVEIIAYDINGQPGLAVPFSVERSALTEMIAGMGNTSGTNIALSSTAGQQITADLSKSAVQGISGYFSKKVRLPKVTLKAGLKIFLVAKK